MTKIVKEQGVPPRGTRGGLAPWYGPRASERTRYNRGPQQRRPPAGVGLSLPAFCQCHPLLVPAEIRHRPKPAVWSGPHS